MKHRHTTVRIVVISLAVTIAILSTPTRAGVCEEAFLRHQREDESGYRERVPNRCEGFFKEKEIAGQFEVISFTFGVLRFDWREDVVLDVGFPDAGPDLDRDAIHVVAMSRASGSYYRLDGRLPMRWPIGDVLYPSGLNARKLGIFGIVESGDIYVPLHVVQRPSEAGDRPRDAAVLRIRPTIPVENVSWQVSPRRNGPCSDYSKRTQIYNARFLGTAAEIQFAGGEVISLELPIDLTKTVCIKVEGQSQRSGERVRYMLTAYFPPYDDD